MKKENKQIKSGLRTDGNYPVPVYINLRKEANILLKPLIKKYGKKLHPDLIEVSLCREIYLECALLNIKQTQAINEK
jgi:hypothetical protein